MKSKCSMKILRNLPDPPRPATRATFKKEVVGEGKYTRTVDRPQKLHMTPGKWPRSKPKAKKQAATNQPHKATARKEKNTKRVIELYDEGYTVDQIMCETGLAQTTVNRYIRNAKGSRYMQRYKHDAEIVQMYDEGLSIMEMSERLDVPDHYIRNMLRRLRAEGKIGWRNRGWEEKALSE